MNKIGSESYKLNGGTTPVSKYRVRRGDDTVTSPVCFRYRQYPLRKSAIPMMVNLQPETDFPSKSTVK